MNTPPRVLLVHKISRYQQVVLEEGDESVQALIDAKDVSVARLLRSHQTHERTLEVVRETLERHHIEYTTCPRGELPDVNAYDLAISVGGDGTVLNLSHHTLTTPILAINSDPESSVGYFCAGTAEDFNDLLLDALQQSLQPKHLERFCVNINDTIQTPPVLNDVLVCHANPAAVTSYILRIDDIEEAQRSSGIWISTPAGSTGAIRSAGGLVLPLSSKNIQFLVREPYPPKTGAYRLLKGIRSKRTPIELISKTYDGRIYLDGPHNMYEFGIGDRLRIDYDAPPLQIYGLDTKLRNH